MDKENIFVSTFIVPEKQERYESQLSKPKKRKEIIDRLNHFTDFKVGHLHQIPPNKQSSNAVLKLLLEHGAPEECYLISSNSAWDRKILRLEAALELIIGSGYGSLICCIPNELAYLETEERQKRYILHTCGI